MTKSNTVQHQNMSKTRHQNGTKKKHNYLKRQKMPKRVKMLTSKWHQKEETSSHIILDPSNAFSLPRTIFCCQQWGRGGGVN